MSRSSRFVSHRSQDTRMQVIETSILHDQTSKTPSPKQRVLPGGGLRAQNSGPSSLYAGQASSSSSFDARRSVRLLLLGSKVEQDAYAGRRALSVQAPFLRTCTARPLWKVDCDIRHTIDPEFALENCHSQRSNRRRVRSWPGDNSFLASSSRYEVLLPASRANICHRSRCSDIVSEVPKPLSLIPPLCCKQPSH